MKKISLLAAILLYVAFMTMIAGCHRHHDHDHDHDHDHEHTECCDDHEHTDDEECSEDHDHEEECCDDHEHDEECTDEECTDDHDDECSLPEHTVMKIEKRDFNFIIRAGGELLPAANDMVTVAARTPGIVTIANPLLFPGRKVSKGDLLFIVSAENLSTDNAAVALLEATIEYERSKELYERAARMVENDLVTIDHYIGMKADYRKAEAHYNNLRGSYSERGSMITSPADGYIHAVNAISGSKVDAGESMITIYRRSTLILKCDVSPLHASLLPMVESANFSPVNSAGLFNTTALRGEIISRGVITGSGSHFIPLYFSIPVSEGLMPGVYAEVYLISSVKPGVIVVPNSSILEEFGKYFVFVEEEDHQFVKRYITRGATNGLETEILEGLHEDEMIVDTGAYAIKMSMMTSDIPHSHTH